MRVSSSPEYPEAPTTAAESVCMELHEYAIPAGKGKGGEPLDPPPRVHGAQERTRTSMAFQPLDPESSASTSFATWASAPLISGRRRPVSTAFEATMQPP